MPLSGLDQTHSEDELRKRCYPGVFFPPAEYGREGNIFQPRIANNEHDVRVPARMSGVDLRCFAHGIMPDWIENNPYTKKEDK